MKFWIEQFFGDAYGLSVTIGFIIMLGIGAWFVIFFFKKMNESEAEEKLKDEQIEKSQE